MKNKTFRLGKQMKAALSFAQRYPGWQSFGKYQPTQDAIKRLAKLGLVEISDVSNQFRALKKFPDVRSHPIFL